MLVSVLDILHTITALNNKTLFHVISPVVTTLEFEM